MSWERYEGKVAAENRGYDFSKVRHADDTGLYWCVSFKTGRVPVFTLKNFSAKVLKPLLPMWMAGHSQVAITRHYEKLLQKEQQNDHQG